MDFDRHQKTAYNIGVSGKNAFISGMAGVGKTYVIRAVIKFWRKFGKRVVVCAFTRQAALNIDADSGVTIFKAFNTYPKGLVFDSKGLFRLSKSLAWNADVIIIDEISMCSKELFSYICKAIRTISKENDYKDIPLIVLGDFFQLPPIAEKGTLVEYAFESKWWNVFDFRYAFLETPHRQLDPEYFEHLCQIRWGQRIKENIEYLRTSANYLTKRPHTITLCSYKDDVKMNNSEVIAKLPGTPRLYVARTNSSKYMDDIGVWECLTLKLGTLVMTTYNDPQDRYYNGATGFIIEMTDDTVTVQFSDSTSEKPHIVEIGAHRWETDENRYVEQLPIIPAYSITIHKAQGCTLDYVNVDPTCFAEGQLYVALSRVKDVKHLYITKEITEKDIKVNARVLRFYENIYASLPYREDDDGKIAS